MSKREIPEDILKSMNRIANGDAVAKEMLIKIANGGKIRTRFAGKILLPELERKCVVGSLLGKLYTACNEEITILYHTVRDVPKQYLTMLFFLIEEGKDRDKTWKSFIKLADNSRKIGKEEDWYPIIENQMKEDDKNQII